MACFSAHTQQDREDLWLCVIPETTEMYVWRSQLVAQATDDTLVTAGEKTVLCISAVARDPHSALQ